MAYQIDPTNGDIIINGFQAGIGDSPYNGFTDIRNVNITSVPGEASINFETQSATQAAISGTITSVSGNVLTFAGATGIANHMGVIFSASTMSAVSTNTLYLVGGLSGSTIKLYSDYGLSSQIAAGSGTGTFTVLTPSQINYFTKDSVGNYWGIDSNGYVWSNTVVIGANNNWTPVGNLPNNDSSGNGIGFYQGTSTHGYIFIFSNNAVDYIQVTTPYTTVYQWAWTAGTTGAWSATPTTTLKTPAGTANSHETNVPPDGKFYFCDANWIGRFYQTSPIAPFNPADITSYTADQTQLLPYNDVANCLSYLGLNLMVGGLLNAVYPWDRFSTQFLYPILLPENVVWKMVTVNTTTYMFVGNRGRIYMTNGTQSQLYKKVPDHLSGTVEPYFTFYGACYQKKQLYFSVAATNNAGTALTTYGGVWAIDLDSGAMRLSNQLSYGTYAGFASAMIAQTPTPIGGTLQETTPQGTGLYIGWNNGASGYGIDQTVTTLYQTGQPYIISDMIPIGTKLKPITPQALEFTVSTPLLTGESIELQVASSLTGSFTSVKTFTGDNSILSGNSESFPLEALQWLLVKIILTAGNGSTPSFDRLTEVRVIGATSKDNIPTQPFSLQ